MTNQAQVEAQVAVDSAVPTAGRPLTAKGLKTKVSVINYVERAEGNFTTKEVRKAVKQSKVYVNNRINALIRKGVIVKVGNKVEGRGRPYAVYAKVAG